MTRLDDALSFHENALRIRSQRQQLLASNIANADTPNFKAKDLDFGKAMQAALTSQKSATLMAQTNAQHLSAPNVLQSSALYERKPLQNNLDGNTVDMDTERNEFTENALRYEVGLSLAHDDIKKLLNVLQG